MRFAIAVIASLVAACSGGVTAGDPDATDGPSGCGDCDAPEDAPEDGGVCTSLRYVSRPIDTIALFEDGTRLNAARSFRVAIGFDTMPCDEDAMPTWRIDAPNHVVTFRANLFSPPGPCAGGLTRLARVITLRLGPGNWRLVGANPGTPPEVAITIAPPPPVACGQVIGDCRQDCDCRENQVCLGGVGLGGPFLACASPCEVDRDCGGGQCTSVEDGLQLVCDASLDECGNPTHSCPSGYSCSGGGCAPDFVLSSTTRHECACDADCAAPLRCIESDIAGRVARCEIPCATGGPWCQGPHVCGPASADVSGLAPSDSVCGYIGE